MRGILTAMLAVFALAQGAFGATLGWDANTESNIAGYRLYYGTTSGNYSQVVDAGNTTQATISNLTAGATYYAAVTAYNTSSLESTKSAEISFVAGGVTPPPPANVPPTVSISGPVSGASYTAPANITLTATASDSDGTVSYVEFYNGTTRLVTVTTPPYTYALNGLAAGTYSFTAKAYDNAGASTTSAAVSVTVKTATSATPMVSLTSPSNGMAYTAPATITVTASASESGGTISKVEFYNGSSLIATDTASPYTTTFTGVPAGTYVLTARAYDAAGVTVTSSPVTVTVGSTPVASKPTVALTSPVSGSTFKAPATVTLSASASETGGTISKVEFYNGSTLLATDTISPYSVTFSGVPAATYTITVRAYDTKGVSTTSAPVTVKVSP